MTSARRRSQSSQRSRSERHASRQRRRRSVQLAAERLEPRAMLATTATLSGNTAPFTLVPVTFRQLDGSVGFSGQAYVGQLSWSGMSGDAAQIGQA